MRCRSTCWRLELSSNVLHIFSATLARARTHTHTFQTSSNTQTSSLFWWCPPPSPFSHTLSHNLAVSYCWKHGFRFVTISTNLDLSTLWLRSDVRYAICWCRTCQQSRKLRNASCTRFLELSSAGAMVKSRLHSTHILPLTARYLTSTDGVDRCFFPRGTYLTSISLLRFDFWRSPHRSRM